MTRAALTLGKTAVRAGTVGLAVIGAVPAAHAADTTGAPAINAQSMFDIRSLLSGDVTRLGLDQLPVVGAVPDMMAKMPVTAVPPVVPSVLKSPGARMRPVSTPTAAPAAEEEVTLPFAGGLGILPLASHLPIDTENTEALLQQLAGNGLSGLGPLGALTHGLGGIAAL